MGRHRAEPEVRRSGHRAGKQAAGTTRSPELLAWGVFLSGTTAVCLLWARASLPLTIGTSLLLLAAFTAAWHASRGSAPAPAPAEASPAEARPAVGRAVQPRPSEPAEPGTPAEKASRHPLPAIPLAPVSAREFMNAPVPGSQTSRWTRAFGPPDTGALPLQPYLPTAHPPVKTADSESHDRLQRSHSSL